MRIAVTGRNGQLAQALRERANQLPIEICTLARPECDLAQPAGLDAALAELRPQAVVNAAAYTAVDLAESEAAIAYSINAVGAGAVSRAAAWLNIPVVQISTDYVFDGSLDRAYREDDPPRPLGVYGSSKLAGEVAVAQANNDHVILRTAWVYSPFGKNFARTMLSLGASRKEISVVSDQLGSPSNALDIADGVLAVVRNLVARPSDERLRGVFHLTGGGETNWAEFAEAIFTASETLGGPSARVLHISTSAYPTPARRPANSRLNNRLIGDVHGIHMPDWQPSLQSCIQRLVAQELGKRVSS